MSKILQDIKYTKEHEWVKIDGNTATFGITDFAQEKLGDIVYVELPDMDKEVKQTEDLCVIESIKAASDVYAPITGTVIAVNEELEASPQLINYSPYNEGWIAKFDNINEEELENLMTAEAYGEFLKTDVSE